MELKFEREGFEVLFWGNPPTGLHNTPIYLGLDTGTFEVPGITIQARDNLTGADYTEALVAGHYDLGHMGTPPLFAALARTDEYVIIGHGLVRYPPFYLMAPAGTKSLRELRGQTVALNKLHTCPHSVIKTILRSEGMEEDEICLSAMNDGDAILASIERREAAGAVLWEPYVSYVERVLNWEILAEGRTTMDPSNYGFMIYVRRSLLSRHPQIVQQVMDAYGNSVRATQQNLIAGAAALHRRMPKVSIADINACLRRESQHWSADLSFDFCFLDNVVSELKEQKLLSSQFALNAHVAKPALRG